MAQQRARGRPGRPNFDYYGAVRGIQQRPLTVISASQQWTPPSAPSLATQAEAAARHKRLSDCTASQVLQLVAAFDLWVQGKDIEGHPPEVRKALASPVLRAELEERAKRLQAAAALALQSAEQPELSEKDYVMLHVRPTPVQGELSEETRERLAACTPASSKPSDLLAAEAATVALNDFMLQQASLGDATSGVSDSTLVALRVVLSTQCVIVSEKKCLSEQTMRCRCLQSALTASGLLPQAGQKKVRVLLPCGITLEVTLQPAPWETVEVMMAGLPTEVSLAQASYMVTDLLEGTGAIFKLLTCSQLKSAGAAVQSGLEMLGIRLMSPSEASSLSACHARHDGTRSLVLQVRRDVVSLLPAVASLQVIYPCAPASSPKSVLAWVSFSVDAKDGHTDPSRCHQCGGAGHAAARCTAERDGHRARFQCFASVPPVAETSVAASGPQHPQAAKHAAVKGKQQQQQQQQQQRQQTHSTDGFATAGASRRTVNKHLNQQATRQPPAVAAAPAGIDADADASSVQHAASGEPRVQQQAADEPTDADIIAESEQMARQRQLQDVLDKRHERLALCLAVDGTVAADHAEQFDQLLAENNASLTAASAAHAHAEKAVTALLALPVLTSPTGKAHATAQGVKVYDQQRKALKQDMAQRETQLATARECESRMHALLAPLQLFAQNLQLYSGARITDSRNQLVLETEATVPQHTTDSCESSLSPVIDIPPDSQVALTAVAAETLEVGPAATAAESPRATEHAAAQPIHPQSQAPASATRAAQLEQHRNELLDSRRDAFDVAEQSGVATEQNRLLLVQQAAGSAQPASAAQSNAADRAAGTSDTDADSSDSGTSEGSESECSDADSHTVKQQHQQQQQQQQQPEQLQHQQQQQPTAPCVTRSKSASIARAATAPGSSSK